MKRRSFLLGSVAILSAPPSLASIQLLGFHTKITSLVITDITPEVSIDHLVALIDAFSETGVPFSCVVNPYRINGQPLQPEDRLSTLLNGYSLQRNIFNVVPYVPDLANLSSYFQGRRVRNANEILRNVFLRYPDSLTKQSSLSVVACDDLDNPKSPTGVRSAGVNTVITIPAAEKPVSSEAWPNSVVRFYGGRKVDFKMYSDVEQRATADTMQAIIYISASNLQSQSTKTISARALEFAKKLLDSEVTGKNTLQLISDLQFRDNYGFRRNVAVHLIRPETGNPTEIGVFDDFLNDLKVEGITASVGSKSGLFEPGRVTDYWLPTSSRDAEAVEDGDLVQVTRACRADLVRLPTAPGKALPVGHSLAFGEANDGTPGFDNCAALWLPCIDIADAQMAAMFSTELGRNNDIVVSIRPEALTHQFTRTSLLNQLMTLASDGVTQIVTVQQLGRLFAPSGAEIERQRRTISNLPRTRSRRIHSTDESRQTLMNDARIAWAYFENNTIQNTGLCPATVNFSAANGRVHKAVTMWDVGSHINALIAAFQLELIEKKQFERNISQILTQIRGRRSQGRTLPQGWLRVDRQKWGTKDFDGSDAGRLLASLENLRRSFGMDDQLSALVDSWDLDKIVIDSEVHSVAEGELHSVYRSHSAHYAARSFRHWGVDAASPYEVFKGRSAYDDQMALLEVVSWIGPLGAEPLLLEALEIGMSKESAYLAEVLFAAQLEDHDETGRLIAVSEGPIDRKPWFTYQGLQTDVVDRTWALDTVGYEPEYAEPNFWRENLVVSSKAAYLWAAYKPHSYSDKLVKHVREKARTRKGFASSIFSKTGRVTSTYTDLNTNAVILQSISKMLTGT